MKSIVIYSSKSGNTKKLAEAVFDSLTGDKELKPVADAPADLSLYDFIAVGFWLMAGKPDPDSAKFLEQTTNQKLFLFATHGAAKDSDHARNAMNAAIELAPDCSIIGTFNCQGEVNPKVIEKARTKPKLPPWVPDAGEAVGHPDSTDIEEIKQKVSDAVQSLS